MGLEVARNFSWARLNRISKKKKNRTFGIKIARSHILTLGKREKKTKMFDHHKLEES